jgi:putative SOS response-associated peptidase YedK
MCGRFALNATPQDVLALFAYEERPNFPPRRNISPTEPIAVVTQEHSHRHFHLMRWGLLPGWLKEPEGFPVLFNARGETITTKPAFRDATRHRRCLVPADAFYEWRTEGKKKVPYRIRKPDGSVFAMAGLWQPYAHANGSEIDTATIVTTDANGTLAALHNRMPVIIPPEHFALWLESETHRLEDALAIIRPAPDDFFVIEPFDPRTGPISEDVPPVKPKKPEQQSLF